MSALGRRAPPPLLQPYLQLPRASSLHLITGVLDATPYWLAVQSLASICSHESDAADKRTAVVMASWMRTFDYWSSDLKKCSGLELARLQADGQFAFIDGLTSLFGDETPRSTLKNPNPPAAVTNSTRPSTLCDPSPATAQRALNEAITRLKTDSRNQRILLVLDAPTLLLAATTTTAAQLAGLVLSVRQQVHSTMLLCEADGPLIGAASPDVSSCTPLEINHAAFVVGQAHQAHLVMSTRPLDTGVARDVSGVLRISRGGSWDADDDADDDDDDPTALVAARGVEVLYHIQPDGKVAVFERGSRDLG